MEYSDSTEFIDACISLEALYNEGPSDLRYKISHRLAFLLGLHGFDSIITFHNADEIYDKRSKLVHGHGHYPKWQYVEQARLYARSSCVCFLILCLNRFDKLPKNDPKPELLKEIDEAMLEPNLRQALAKEITEGIKEHFTPRFKERRNESELQKINLDDVKNFNKHQAQKAKEIGGRNNINKEKLAK